MEGVGSLEGWTSQMPSWIAPETALDQTIQENDILISLRIGFQKYIKKKGRLSFTSRVGGHWKMKGKCYEFHE